MVKINLLDEDIIVQGNGAFDSSEKEEGIISAPKPLIEQPVFSHEVEEEKVEPKGGFDYDILFGGGEAPTRPMEEPKAPPSFEREEFTSVPLETKLPPIFEKEAGPEKPKQPVEAKMEPRNEFRREPIIESRPPMREERKYEPSPRRESAEIFEEESPRSKIWIYISAFVLLIGVGVVLLFVLKQSPKKHEIVTTVSPEEEAKKAAEQQKMIMYGSIISQKVNNLETLKKIQNSIPDRVEISLASITGTKLYIELMAPGRDEVAKFQLNLKKNFDATTVFDVVYSQDNLPSAGNTLSVTITAQISTPPGGTGTITTFQSSDAILAKYLDAAKSNKLKLIHKTIGKITIDNGRVPLVMGFRGTKKSVMVLLDMFQSDNSNYALYKASLATLNPMIPDPKAQVDLFIHVDVLPSQ
jgi:hypothetical protein